MTYRQFQKRWEGRKGKLDQTPGTKTDATAPAKKGSKWKSKEKEQRKKASKENIEWREFSASDQFSCVCDFFLMVAEGED